MAATLSEPKPSTSFRLARLSDIAEVSSGGPAPQEPGDFGGPHPFIRVSHLREDHRVSGCDWLTDAAVAKQHLRLFPAGTIVLPKSGASIRLEKRAILPFDAYLVSHLAAILSDTRQVDNLYLYYWLISARLAEGKAGGYPTLSTSEIRQIEVPLPSLAEQRVIAKVHSTIQRAIQGESTTQAASRRLRESFIETFFNGRQPTAHLQDVLREPLRNGYSPREASKGRVRVFTLSAVTQRDFSVKNTKRCIPERSIDALWARPGDIFIERANTRELVGTAALYEGGDQFAFFPDLLVRVRVDEGQILPKVLDAFLSTQNARRYFQANARGTAGNMPKIDHGIIGNIAVPVLSREEQVQFAARLNAIDRAIDASQRRLNSLRNLWRTALTDLLSGNARSRT